MTGRQPRSCQSPRPWMGSCGWGRAKASIVSIAGKTLVDDDVLSLMAEKDGSLWVGYLNGGMSRIGGKRSANYEYEREDVPQGSLIGFARDASGRLWAATPMTVVWLDPTTDTWRTAEAMGFDSNWGPKRIYPPGDDTVMFQLPSLKAQAHALLLAPTVDDAASLAIYRHVGEGASEQTLRHLDNVAAGRSWPASRVGSIDDLQVDTSIVLALAPLPAPPVNRDVAGVQLLVPALFMDSAAAEAWRARGATVRVSFPYPPQPIASPGQWVGPEQAWIALSCELLGRLPRMPTEAGALGEWREQVGMMQGLHLAGWFDLPARSNFEDQIGRVEVMEWPFE